MKIIYEYTNITASKRLEAYVEKKLTPLFVNYDFIIRADVFLKKENHSDGTGHDCGIRLSAPGPRLFAHSDDLSFEKAISNTIRNLKDQLEKRKNTTFA